MIIDFPVTALTQAIMFASMFKGRPLASKDLTTAKKVTSRGTRPDARYYYWFKTLMPDQLS